jgi:hypothetical protein
MRAEYVRQWLTDAQKPEEEGGDSTKWDAYVRLIKQIFTTGQIPHKLHWSILVLLPKSDGGESEESASLS